MKLFDKLKGKGADGTLDTSAAVMVPIVGAMLADGRVEDEELAQIHAICATSPIYERNSKADNDALISQVTRLIEDNGIDVMCKKAAKLLSPALKETSFVYAVMVVFSDGYVGKLEREVIENMTEWLGVTPERARNMVEVVSVMHHPIGA